MNRNPRIEIKTVEGTSGAFTEIYVDGHKLNGVRSYSLAQDKNCIPILTVDLNALNISVDCPAVIVQDGFGEIEEIKFRS